MSDFNRIVDRVFSGGDGGSRPAYCRPYVEPAAHRRERRPLPADMQQALDELAAKDEARRRAALAAAWKPAFSTKRGER